MQPIRLMTWNLWGRHGQWELRQQDIIETLHRTNSDIVGLQEVWVDNDDNTQAKVLADSLQFDFHFALASNSGHTGIGNALLSRWPIEAKEETSLPAEAGSGDGRVVAHARVNSPSGLIPVLTTHLSWQRNASDLRQRQVSVIQEIARDTGQADWPPILLGDFNADACSDEIRMLTGRRAGAPDCIVFQDAWEQGGDCTPGYTWTPDNSHFEFSRTNQLSAMPWLRRRIDYIFIGLPDGQGENILPVQIERAWLDGRSGSGRPDGSDHYAVLADCSLLHILRWASRDGSMSADGATRENQKRVEQQ